MRSQCGVDGTGVAIECVRCRVGGVPLFLYMAPGRSWWSWWFSRLFLPETFHAGCGVAGVMRLMSEICRMALPRAVVASNNILFAALVSSPGPGSGGGSGGCCCRALLIPAHHFGVTAVVGPVMTRASPSRDDVGQATCTSCATLPITEHELVYA